MYDQNNIQCAVPEVVVAADVVELVVVLGVLVQVVNDDDDISKLTNR